jgi:signal transduction histidine kinase
MEKLSEEMKPRSVASFVTPEANVRKARPRRSATLGKAKLVASTLSPPERERLRAALHDGLGQLLTSISFMATSLRQKLAAKELPEATDAAEILSLTSQAISETQALVQDEPPLPLA